MTMKSGSSLEVVVVQNTVGGPETAEHSPPILFVV